MSFQASAMETENFRQNMIKLAQLYIKDGKDIGGDAQVGGIFNPEVPVQDIAVDRTPKSCGFCKRNGDPDAYYTSHNLRENGLVTCPILQKHVCELCGATGPEAHTRSYCKVAIAGREVFSGTELSSRYHNTVALKRSSRDSSGRTRRQERPRRQGRPRK